MKAPLTVLGSRTVEPKGVAQPITLYDVAGLGGAYALELPRREMHWATVEPGLPLTFRLVAGKDVVGEEQEGVLVRLSVDEAEIRSQAPPPPYTDLQLMFKPDAATAIAGIYGKVLDRATAGERFALRFTALPQEARQFVEGVVARRG